MSHRALTALALLGLTSLSACGPTDPFPPLCPQLALVPDAADLTEYRPQGHDITDLVTDARINAVPGSCTRGSGNTVKTTIRIVIDLSRGPAATSRDISVPAFVAVTDGSTILDKQEYRLGGTFAANVDQMRVTSDDIVLNVPVTPAKSAAAYKVYVGFTLTPEELALNRQRGPR